ncbi:HEAT repeat domain-containing protein [Myxococcus stipitatus]|uniref:HEAT repeat domain-containing protein n=1 Tax=Myxococcus stipitatus TaxID=83455 RepID=UPI001F24B96F|nr:HEAT repeat domain-containing protein [Myxococcus stipitatus]MCE9673939.1 HEAT repeat domain-containing protein [Myxococcus stipitatus]
MTTPTSPSPSPRGSFLATARAPQGRWWCMVLGVGLLVGPAGTATAAHGRATLAQSSLAPLEGTPPEDLRARVLALLDQQAPPREEAWRQLGPQAIPVLNAMVMDGTVPAPRRSRAMASLAMVDPSQGASSIQEVLADVRAPAEVRASAAQSLGRCLGIDAIPILATRLTDREDQVREAVAVALGRLGGQQARLALEERLPVEERPLVREALQRGLSLTEP